MGKIFCLFVFSLLSGCASGTLPSSGESPVGGQVEKNISYAQLRSEFASLPGALVSETDPLIVSFPVGTLFAAGAVLPMPGGAGLLDALARVVKDSNLLWQMKVRAATDGGQRYNQDLAEERVRVLKVYLTGSGVNLRHLRFSAVAEGGASLEMLALQPVPTLK